MFFSYIKGCIQKEKEMEEKNVWLGEDKSESANDMGEIRELCADRVPVNAIIPWIIVQQRFII
jgi:hypothetical protein